MNPTRIWTLGAVIAVVAILGGAVGLGVQPQLAAASAADASTKGVQQATGATQIELARLAKVAASQSVLEQEQRRLESAVTGTLKLNTFSRQLREIAALDGVKITSLAPATGVAYAPPVSAEPAPVATASSSSSSEPVATTAPVAVAPGQFGTTDPLITASNFVVIPVTLVVAGDEASGLAFAQDAQHMSRLFAVSNVVYSKGSDTDAVPTTTISGTIYSLKR